MQKGTGDSEPSEKRKVAMLFTYNRVFFVTLPTEPQPTLARTSRGAVRIRRSESNHLAEDASVCVCIYSEHTRIAFFLPLRVEFY